MAWDRTRTHARTYARCCCEAKSWLASWVAGSLLLARNTSDIYIPAGRIINLIASWPHSPLLSIVYQTS